MPDTKINKMKRRQMWCPARSSIESRLTKDLKIKFKPGLKVASSQFVCESAEGVCQHSHQLFDDIESHSFDGTDTLPTLPTWHGD